MNVEFKKSLVVFIPLAIIQAIYQFQYNGSYFKSMIYGLISASCVFFVPLLFKRKIRKP